MDHFDVTIIGAGVVGLAIAHRLSATPSMKDASIVILEQEDSFGQHISSRNSEVIHAGIYYAPGSLKARFCVRGRELIYEHCRQFQIPHRRVGKFIVAKHQESEVLEQLFESAISNGVNDLLWYDKSMLTTVEPAVSADHALYSPSSGIIDSHSFMHSLLSLSQDNGVLFAARMFVREIDKSNDSFLVKCELKSGRSIDQIENYEFRSSSIINCAGLGATQLSGRINGVLPASIPHQYFCKGDYFTYTRTSPFKHLVYPLPESGTVGLGIHATLDLAGRVKFGPDTQYVDEPSFEVAPHKAELFSQRISSYFPSINSRDLLPGYSGIRPKISGPDQSSADFIIQDCSTHEVPGLIQLFGIESPGLTASLAIAEHIVELV